MAVVLESDILSQMGDALTLSIQAALTDEYTVVNRTLRPADANKAIGVFVVDWHPVVDSYEMHGQSSPLEPTLQRYNWRVQNMIKAGDEVTGRREYANDSKIVRAILYRDAGLAVRLRDITESTFGTTERVKRWGLTTQRFLNNEVRGVFIYLASTDMWIETENV